MWINAFKTLRKYQRFNTLVKRKRKGEEHKEKTNKNNNLDSQISYDDECESEDEKNEKKEPEHHKRRWFTIFYSICKVFHRNYKTATILVRLFSTRLILKIKYKLHFIANTVTFSYKI